MDTSMEGHALAGDADSFALTLARILGQEAALELLHKSIACLSEKHIDSALQQQQQRKPEERNEIIPERREIFTERKERFHHGHNTVINFEVLDTVFKYLDYQALCKVSEVCKAWRTLALDPAYWSCFKPLSMDRIKYPPLSSTSSTDLRYILRLPRFGLLHSLDLTPWSEEVDDDWIVQSLTHLNNLKTLSLLDCKKITFSHPELTKLVALTSVNLGAVQMGQLVSNSALTVLQNLTNLRNIDLHYCEKLNDYGLSQVATLPKLQSLDLGDCYKLTSTALSMLAPLSTSLTFLSLRSPIRSNFSIKDDGLSYLSTFTRLTHLDIGWCKRITDKGMPYIANLKEITHLGLAYTAITDVGFRALGSLKKIQVLNLMNCYQLTTEAAALLTQNYPLVRVVNLRGVPLGKHSSWVLSKNLRFSAHLEDIDFTNTYIDDATLAPQHCKQAANVKTVNVSYCPDITDATIFNICTYMGKVSTIIMSHCHRLTDKALEHLPLAKNLTKVDISAIYSLTKEGLEKFMTVCPHVTVINTAK